MTPKKRMPQPECSVEAGAFVPSSSRCSRKLPDTGPGALLRKHLTMSFDPLQSKRRIRRNLGNKLDTMTVKRNRDVTLEWDASLAAVTRTA